MSTMRKDYFEEVEFPSLEQKEAGIARIVSQGTLRPQKFGAALWEIWKLAGIRGIFFGVWDCMLCALLADGLLWAAVYESAKQDARLLGLLVFLASPVLYALLHLLTAWKERMAGMYETLVTCRISLGPITALRLFIFSGVSAVLSGCLNLCLGIRFGGAETVLRLFSLSLSALFFYAWMQALLECKWKSRMSCFAAPVLWGTASLLLFAAGSSLRVLEEIPSAALPVCAGVCAWMYRNVLKAYLFAPCACNPAGIRGGIW